jgi:hypothetical protein
MGFILLFIYLNYMEKTGYHISAFDWICVFAVGVLQLLAWTIRTGTYRLPYPDDTKPKRLDELFRD